MDQWIPWYSSNMTKFRTFIETNEKTSLDTWLFILNNAVTHKSNKFKEYIKENNISVAYIPPYMPELAPIERLLAKLKNFILKRAISKKN